MNATEQALETADLLERAANRIERYGHCKDLYYTGGDEAYPFTAPSCARGAIRLSAGFDPYGENAFPPAEVYDAEAWLSRLLWDRGDARLRSVTAWNDMPERTADEVVAALRFAARKARAAA